MYSLTAHYALIMAFFWSNFTVLSNYASVYLLGHQFRNTEIGFMIAAASLLSALVQPLVGIYADRPRSLSVKQILFGMTGLFLMATVLISISSERSPLILIVSYAVALMLLQSMIPFTNALGTLSAGAGHRINFGIARGVGSLAYAIASILIGMATERFGISIIPLTAIGAYTGLGLCLLPFPFRKNTVTSKKDSSKGFLKKYPGFVIILAASSCLYSSHVLLGNFAFQIISSKGGNSESLGFAYAIAAVMELPMMFCFTRLLKRMNAGKWLIVSGFAFFVKSAGTLVASNVAGFQCVQSLQILAYAVITVASVYYIDDIMKPEDAVKGQAFFTMTNTIGSVLASAIGGWLLDISGVTSLVTTAIGFAGIGAITMLVGVKKS